MSTSNQVVALIPAAGRGARLGGQGISKGLLELNGRTLVEHIAAVLKNAACIERVVLLIDQHERGSFAKLDYSGLKVEFVNGGSTRQESVRAGIEFLEREGLSPQALVVVHDVARPLLKVELLKRSIAAARKYRAVTCSVAVTDTIRSIEGDRSTQLDRSSLVAVQTPQVFEFGLLSAAHRSSDLNATDDAGLVEKICPVKVIEGDRTNIKITHPEDLRIATALFF